MSRERIERRFAEVRGRGRAAFMPYFTLGYPTPEASLEVVRGLLAGGADLLELGVPFSDPLADGPVLQAAAQQALASGTTWPRALELVARIRSWDDEVPLVLLVYANTACARGVERFVAEVAQAGADGVILPDWPPDEGDGLREALAGAGLAAVGLVSPVSPAERIAAIAAASQGFLYAVSVTGVTGERPELSRELGPLVQRIRRVSALPVAAGFGISRPEDAQAAARLADGVIVGSALARQVAGTQGQDLERLARDLARRYRKALEEAALSDAG
ncbi:MAG TPA: tryptophan synthase subunit alpha [Limnochorda sp.]